MKVLVSIQQPVTAWQIPPAGVAVLENRFPHIDFVHATDDEGRARGLIDCDVAFTWILRAPELATATRLKWLHSSAVAVETLCLPELFARNISVSNSRGVQALPIAEHVLTMILALAKQIPFITENQRARKWAQNEVIGPRLPWLLKGRTLGLIGVGTIGSEVARLATAFGMRVIAIRRRAEGGAVTGVHEMLPSGALTALLERSDVVVIAAPLTSATERLLGADQFARLKRGSIVVNVGRARILDHRALVDALQSGHLAGAALDVLPQEPLPPDDPLWSAPNLLLTPHTSGFRQGHWDDVIDLFSENLRRYETGEPVKFRVEPQLGY